MKEYVHISLLTDGYHPNGMTAWKDDALLGCFFVNNIPIYEPCTDLVLDSGSNTDVVYSPDLNQDWIDWNNVAPGVQFRAEINDVFSYSFQVSHWPEPSIDLVFVDSTDPFGLLGIRFFLENDVGYNLHTGEIVLRAHDE